MNDRKIFRITVKCCDRDLFCFDCDDVEGIIFTDLPIDYSIDVERLLD